MAALTLLTHMNYLQGRRELPRHGWDFYHYYVGPKYFSELGQAVSAAYEREIRLDSASTLNDAIEAIDKIAARYNKLLDDAPNDVESRRAA